MTKVSDPVSYPELIFGTAGPIGVDMDGVVRALTDCLKEVGYHTELIKLTDEMLDFRANIPKAESAGRFDDYWWKMDYANALRKRYERPDTLARIAINAIRRIRANRGIGEADAPADRTAYVIRQLKHPEEVRLLRKVYGVQFVLISCYATEEERRKNLINAIKATESTQISASAIENKANMLIERDASEVGEKLGQQLRDTFHLADVFVDGMDPERMRAGISRFIRAFFGRTDITPRKDEYGMYAAASAALRSADLSRQVGAAIFTGDGDLVTQGCNEVPKALGGTYWDSETPDYRDIKKGYDPNERHKREVLRDLIERLRVAGCLSDSILAHGSDIEIVNKLVRKVRRGEEGEDGPLAESWLMDLTEYGRVVHAEMSAICDAARNGKNIRDCTLFCTTFPCHNCTKHIISAGIKRVVYMEPYPKSRAKELHEDEIELESERDQSRVSFVPFLGISPLRYQNVFQKGRRKSAHGAAVAWLQEPPQPIIEIDFPSYTKTGELWALGPLIGTTFPAESETSHKEKGNDDGTR